MKWFFARYVVLVGVILSLAGCYPSGSSAPAPTGFAVTAGDGGATLSWNVDTGVEYWAWCALGTSITVESAASVVGLQGLQIRPNVQSPYAMSGLLNGSTYSCTVNGRYNGGPGGPGSPSISFVPRLAGASWVLGADPGAVIGATTLRGVAYGATFVAVGDAGTIFTSAEGKTWTAITPLDATKALYAAVYGGSYVAAGQAGMILTSPDAVAWTALTPVTGNDLLALATNGGGVYIAAGQAGTLLYSSGAQTWVAATTQGAPTENFTGVAFGSVTAGIMFVAVSDQGGVLTSIDGMNWTRVALAPAPPPLYAVTYGIDSTVTPPVGRFIAVGAAGTVLTSTDGAVWSAQAALGVNALRSITYGRQFVAVGDGGSIYTSADGLTWQPQTSGTAQPLLAIGHSSGYSAIGFGYVAAGASGINLTAY